MAIVERLKTSLGSTNHKSGKELSFSDHEAAFTTAQGILFAVAAKIDSLKLPSDNAAVELRHARRVADSVLAAVYR